MPFNASPTDPDYRSQEIQMMSRTSKPYRWTPIVRWVHIAAVVLFFAVGASPALSQTEPSSFVVDGLPLGAHVIVTSNAYKQYQCAPSGTFPGFTWCHKLEMKKHDRNAITLSNSILHTEDGTAWYINRYIEPAFFDPNDIQSEVAKLSTKLGQPVQQLSLPAHDGAKAIIVVWGGIKLEALEGSDVAAVRAGRSVGALLVGLLGDVQQTAKAGLPVYRLAGGAGYLWAATYNRHGRGVLRFLAVDASKIAAASEGSKTFGSGPLNEGLAGPATAASSILHSTREPTAAADLVLTEDAPETDCDTYASNEVDPNHKGAGLRLNKINAGLAVPACEAAVRQYPRSGRLITQLGRAYQRAGKFEAAMAQYHSAADRGYAPAEYDLGGMYERGLGVSQDYSQAMVWYRKAAASENAAAENNIGAMFAAGKGVPKDDAQAAVWYLRAAAKNNEWAQYNLGILYENGQGVPQDYEKAIDWYSRSADQGNASAQYNLGNMIEGGRGIQQDFEKAIELYRKAADQDYALAQSALGVMYLTGRGIPRDEAISLGWFRKAAENGYAPAQYRLGEMYANGERVSQDYVQALQWFRRAAQNGDANAQYALGFMYQNGKGVAADKKQAAMWYRKAADGGHAKAQLLLGIMYQQGDGVPQDYTQAIPLMRQAAASAEGPVTTAAKIALGSAYALGQGVPNDFHQADVLFREASEKWNELPKGTGIAAMAYGVASLYNEVDKRFPGLTPDASVQALNWYQRAADAGNKEAAIAAQGLRARMQARTVTTRDPNDVVAAVLNFTTFGNDDGANGRFWFQDPANKCHYLLHRDSQATSDDTFELLRNQLGQGSTATGRREIDLDTLDPKNITFKFDGVDTVTQHANQMLFVYVGQLDIQRLERGWTLIYTKYCSGTQKPF
jgi:TPR repeat protein